MSSEGILGAPILDSEHRYIGFVDMSNIVWYISHMFHAWSLQVQHIHIEPLTKKIWAEFFQLQQFRDITIKQVLHYQLQMHDHQNAIPPFYPSYRGFSTFSVMEQMALLGTRRVAVLDDDSKVIGLITQSMLISLLEQNMHQLGNIKDILVADIVAGWTQEAQCISEETLAIHAFKALAINVSHSFILHSQP